MTLSKQFSPQFNAVQQFYDAVTTWKFDVLESLFSEDYVSIILPASANVPPKNKTEGIQHAKEFGASIGYAPLKYEIFELIEAPGSVWTHSRLYGDIPGGPSFNVESIYVFTLSTGDDIKITAISEFVDTKLQAPPSTAGPAAAAPAEK